MDISMSNSKLDIKQIESIDQRETLAFLNYWVKNTIIFLNQFSIICHQKLQGIDEKINKVNNQLCVLENKLSSIAGLEDTKVKTSLADTAIINTLEDSRKTVEESEHKITSLKTAISTECLEIKEINKPDDIEEKLEIIKYSEHPVYKKYFKMISVGVPEAAVRIKMRSEGLDDSILKTPNAPVIESDVSSD